MTLKSCAYESEQALIAQFNITDRSALHRAHNTIDDTFCIANAFYFTYCYFLELMLMHFLLLLGDRTKLYLSNNNFIIN